MESVETPSSNPTISGSSGTTAVREVVAEVREGTYGDRVVAVEPGGAEFIPLDERHGSPIKLLLDLGVAQPRVRDRLRRRHRGRVLRLSFWQAVAGASCSAPDSARSPRASCPRAARSTACRR